MPAFFAVPRLPRGMIRRERLLEPLDADSPLVVVRGFAGTGKTMLVADWLHARRGRLDAVAWHAVERSDRAEFWARVISTVSDAAGLESDAPLALLRAELERAELERAVPSGSEPPATLRRLLVRGFARLDRGVLLVLDDLHHVADVEVADDVLAVVRASTPLRVVATTRNRGTFREAAVAAVDGVLVRGRDLLFTRGELAGIVAASALPDEDSQSDGGGLLDRVWAASGGVPLLACRMLAIMGEHFAEHGTLPDSGRPEEGDQVGVRALREALGTEHPADDGDVEAILRLSAADVLTEGLAVELTGRDDVFALLDIVESIGAGAWSVDASGGMTFAFVPRLLHSLRAELHRVSGGESAQLKRIALRWAQQDGRPAEALRLAVELDDYALASTVVLDNYESLLADDRAAVTVVLDGVSRRTLAGEPVLALLLGLCLDADPDHRSRAREVFAIAQVGVRQTQAHVVPLSRAVNRMAESIALRVAGQFEEALIASDRLLDLLDTLSLDDRDRLAPHLPRFLAQAGLAQAAGGRLARARELYSAAFALPRRHSEVGHLHALALCAGAAAIDGDMVEAARLAAVADAEEWPPESSHDYSGAFLEVCLAVLELEAGAYDAVTARIDAMDYYLPNGEHWPHLVHLKAMALLGLGRSVQGAALIESVLEPGARPPIPACTVQWLTAAHATLLAAAGHRARAGVVLAGADHDCAPVRFAAARFHLAADDAVSARAAVQATDAPTPRLRAEQLLLRAAAALRLGETDYALDTFERAVVLLDERRMRHPFVLLPDSDRHALVGIAVASGRMERFRGTLASMLAVQSPLPEVRGHIVLTDRERVVLGRLRERVGAAAIAESLFVSVNTVKSQLRSLYRKLGVSSREEALARAHRLGLFEE